MTTPAPAPQPPVYDDEIDLFELAQDLWREKVLVIGITLAVFAAVFAYVVLTPTVHVYTAEATLVRASLHHYGPLAAALKTEGKQGVQIASELTAANFDLLQKNLESSRIQQEFFAQYAEYNGSKFAVQIPKGSRDTFILSVSSNSVKDLTKQLQLFLEFGSEQTAAELNDFLLGLGVDQQVAADMFYSIGKPAAKGATESKPKKKLILTIGIVLGGMLGIFAALLRSAIRKRKKSQQASV